MKELAALIAAALASDVAAAALAPEITAFRQRHCQGAMRYVNA